MLDEISNLPQDAKDAAQLAQAQLREGIEDLDKRVSELERERKSRRLAQLGLKSMSVLGGILIVTGFLNESVVQGLGGLISAITALERVFANFDRLLAVTAARNAYARIRREIESRHNREIVGVVRIRDRKPEEAIDQFLLILTDLSTLLDNTRMEIENRLENNDYDSLGTLTLDDENGPRKT